MISDGRHEDLLESDKSFMAKASKGTDTTVPRRGRMLTAMISNPAHKRVFYGAKNDRSRRSAIRRLVKKRQISDDCELAAR